MLRSPLIMEDSFAEKFSTAAPPTISTIGVFPKVPSTKLFLPAPMNEEEANFIVLVAPAPKNDWLEEEIILLPLPAAIKDLSLCESIEQETPDSIEEKSELRFIRLCAPAPITELKLDCCIKLKVPPPTKD